MRPFSAAFAAVLLFAGGAGGPRVFDGDLSDSQCAFNVHSHDRSHDDMIKTNTMGSTPEECAITCVRHRNGKYVLIDPVKKKIYRVEPQAVAEKFAGKKVHILGVYDKDADVLNVIEIKPF